MNWQDEDLDRTLHDLREPDDAALSPAALAAVRARVMGRLNQHRPSYWRWAWLPALAAAVVLVAVIPSPRPEVVPPPPLLAHLPAAPPMQKAPALPRLAAPAPVPAPQPRTEFAKILTDDPDVIILWALDARHSPGETNR